MIRYALKCSQDHAFESWFASAAAYEVLAKAGQLACVECGSVEISKSLMAPAVRPARAVVAGERPLSTPTSPMEQAIAALRKQVEENSDYVGLNFAAEARAIHAGDAPERAIFGEAKLEEARALIEEGVPVAPLPFLPQRRAN